MAEDKNSSVIIALFPGESQASVAVNALKDWDKANDDIKLGAIGTIVKEIGKVRTQVGRRTGKGAKVGVVVGVAAAVLSGGATLVGSVLAGGALGGALGAFFKKSLTLTKEEIDRLGADLDAGRVAVVVTCDAHEVQPTIDQLTHLGGTVRSYAVPDDALDEAAQTLAADSEDSDKPA
jgi:hypothetical protein